MSDSVGKLRQLQQQHDELIVQLRNERQALGLDPTQIPPALGERAARFTGELRDLGASLYATEDRSAALSLMAYWINALYRAGWYQERKLDPPAPELLEFSPEAQPPLRDEDYPWDSAQGQGVTPESRVLWARMSAQAVSVLASRRLLGITGAAGSGRSHLIDHGIRPALREKADSGALVEHILNPGQAILNEVAQGPGAALEDRRFLTALLPLAQAAGGGGCDLNEATLERDPAALARMLDATGRRHLVIVHDLHRLFTLASDPFDLEPNVPQRAFVSALCAIACSAGGHQVIVDVQTDFLGRLRKFEDFRALIDRPDADSAQDGWLVVAFEAGEIRKFITEPAGRVGLHFEAGLVDRLVFEHQAEPAAITLLLFTLRRLWRDMLLYHCDPGERRNMITWMNYRRVGSGRLVFEIAADEAAKAVLDREISAEEKEQALNAIRIVFLELVKILPGSSFWLPKVPRAAIQSALENDGHPAARIARIFDGFTRVGLLVEQSAPTSDGTVLRIFHDAVVTRWTRLVQWVEAKRADRRTYWLFRADARDWNRLREPSPALANAGWWARTKDWILRLHSRQSRLWRGSKLREASAFPDLTELNPYETDFLRVSRRVWWTTIAALAVALAAIPVAIIAAFMLWEAQQRNLNMALFMDRGVNLVAEGDPGTASLWLAEVRQLDHDAPMKRFLGISSPAREAAHNLGIGMAFRRMPDLEALAIGTGGSITTEISPTGSHALVIFTKKGASNQEGDASSRATLWDLTFSEKDEAPGRVRFWDLNGASPQGTELQLDTTKPPVAKADFSIDRGVFAKWADDATPPPDGDTLVAFSGSFANGTKSSVFVRDLREPGKTERIEFDGRVRDMAFFRGQKGKPWRLAVALSDETKQPARGAVQIIELDGSGKLLRRTLLEVKGPATRVVASGDRQFAVACSDPESKTWEVAVFADESGWKRQDIKKDLVQVTDLAFARNGCALAIATTTTDNSAGGAHLFTKVPGKPWVETGADASLQLGSGMQRVDFSPDGLSFFAAASNGVIGIWSLDVGGKVTLLRKLTEGGWTYSAAWSPDGRWIATGNRDRYARLWDAASGQLVLPPLYHGATVGNVRFTPDGLHLLTSTSNAVRLWSTAPREASLLPVQAVERRGSHALLGEDGLRVAVTSVLSGQSRDGVREADLAVWEISPEKSLVPQSRLRRLPVLDKIAASPDGATLAALTEPQSDAGQAGERKVRRLLVWRTADNKLTEAEVEAGTDFLAFVPGSPQRLLVAGALTSAALTPAGGKVSVGFLQLFDLSRPTLDARRMPLEFRVKASAANRTGTLLAIGGDAGASPRGGFIGVLDVASAASADAGPFPAATAAIVPSSHHEEAITSLAFSTDSRWLLSGSTDDRVKLFRVDAARSAPSGNGARWVGMTPVVGDAETKHTADVTTVGFSHGGRGAVSTGRDSVAILWNASDKGLEQRAILDHRGVVSRHAFSADDRWLATGGDEGVRLWSLGSDDKEVQCELVAALPHRFPVVGIAFRQTPGSKHGELCTLAHERASADPAAQRAVEAHRWSLEPELGETAGIRSHAELLAGRKLDDLRAAGLSPEELGKRWNESKEKRPPPASADKAHLAHAAVAAGAGGWQAATLHLRELPEFATPGTAGGRQDVLQFAVDIFAANHQPQEVFAAIEKLGLDTNRTLDEETKVELREKRGEACIRVARAAAANEIMPWLDRAEVDFKELARQQSAEPAWLTRLAEIRVLRGELPQAIKLLGESKQLTNAPPPPGARLMVRFTTASHDQRIAALHLLLAAEAQGKGDAAEASLHRQQWESLVREALDRNKISKAFEKGRAAWSLVLGQPQDKQVVEQAIAFAKEGYDDRPDSYGRANTYAVALMRGGRFDEAAKTLDLAIDLYERTRDPLDRGKPRPGRPLDWVVRALILHGQSTQEKDAARRRALLAEADGLLDAANTSLKVKESQSQITWRATWNNVDLQVLVAEAKDKLTRAKRIP